MANYRVNIPCTAQCQLTVDFNNMDIDQVRTEITKVNTETFLQYGALGIEYVAFDTENATFTVLELNADTEEEQEANEE